VAPAPPSKPKLGVLQFEDAATLMQVDNIAAEANKKRDGVKMKRRAAGDRLGDDKEYLFRLAHEVNSSNVQARSVDRKVSAAADEALSFLRARDEFWKQVDLGAKVAAPHASSRLDFTTIPRSS